MSTVDAVLWDLGGVLCEFRPDRRTAALARASGRSPQQVENVVDAELLRNLDLGTITPPALLDHVRTALDWDCDYADLTRAWCSAFMPDHRVLAIARRVTVTSALLTDMNEPLASAAGNAVEVAYVLDYLSGRRREPRFHAVTVALGAEMLRLGGLAADEAEGRRRGCVAAVLYTISFQAPGFYERHGWRRFGEVACLPPGTSRIFLSKTL